MADLLEHTAPPPPAPADSSGRAGGTSWARFGRLLLRDGIVAIPRALFLYQQAVQLTARETWFVAAILAHKWASELPTPSLKQLARDAAVRWQGLQQLRAELQRRQLLKVRAN